MRKLALAEAAYDVDWHAFGPLAAAWRAGRPDEDAVDWDALLDGRRCAVSTYDLDAAEAATRRQIASGYFRGGHLQSLGERRLAAYGQVRWFRAAQAANDERHCYGPAADRNSELCETVSELEDVLVAMPAPHLAALLWKMERLITDENGSISPWTFDYIEPMLNDARRLLGGAA